MVFPSSVQYPTYLPLLMSATKLSRLSIVFSDTWHSFCTADASESVQIQRCICLAVDLAPPSTHLDSIKGIREAVLLAELENNLDHTVMRGEKCCRRPVRCLLDDTASIAHSLSRLYLQRHGDGRV